MDPEYRLPRDTRRRRPGRSRAELQVGHGGGDPLGDRANLGGGGACDRGRAQTVRAFGDRWRTAKGLRVGQPLARLRSLYPGATRHRETWWLVTGLSQIGAPHRYPVLAATVRGGTVRSFSTQILAAGD